MNNNVYVISIDPNIYEDIDAICLTEEDAEKYVKLNSISSKRCLYVSTMSVTQTKDLNKIISGKKFAWEVIFDREGIVTKGPSKVEVTEECPNIKLYNENVHASSFTHIGAYVEGAHSDDPWIDDCNLTDEERISIVRDARELRKRYLITLLGLD